MRTPDQCHEWEGRICGFPCELQLESVSHGMLDQMQQGQQAAEQAGSMLQQQMQGADP